MVLEEKIDSGFEVNVQYGKISDPIVTEWFDAARTGRKRAQVLEIHKL